ncbi:hypothetical protein QTN25_009014 [Entamoeba marina]
MEVLVPWDNDLVAQFDNVVFDLTPIDFIPESKQMKIIVKNCVAKSKPTHPKSTKKSFSNTGKMSTKPIPEKQVDAKKPKPIPNESEQVNTKNLQQPHQTKTEEPQQTKELQQMKIKEPQQTKTKEPQQMKIEEPQQTKPKQPKQVNTKKSKQVNTKKPKQVKTEEKQTINLEVNKHKKVKTCT